MADKTERRAARDTWAEWGRTLLWLNLLAVPVVFSTRTTESFEFPKVAVLRAVALVLAVGAGALALGGVRADRGRRLRESLRSIVREPIALGIALSLVAASVSTLVSISPRTSILGAQGSFAGLLTMAAFAVLFFATRALCPDADSARSVLSGAVVGLGLSVAYGLVQLAGLDPLRWEAISFSGVARVFSTQGHPNSFAQLLAVGLPVAAYALLCALRVKRAGEAVVLALVVAGALGLALLTLSRAGTLAMGTAVLVLTAGWAMVAGVRRARIAIGAGLALVCVAALALTMLSDSGEGLRTMRGRLVGNEGLLGQDSRRFLWAGAWAAFRDHPVGGVGLDCFSLVFGRYRTPASWSAEWGETPL